MGDFMGKKINFFLLLMLILLVLGMGGMSIYYQRTFKEVNGQYNELSSNHASCQGNLTETALLLQNTLSNLNNTESDIRKYDTLYEQKAQELEDKKKELTQTQTKLQTETLFKEQFKKQSEESLARIQVLNTNVSRLTNMVADLQDEMARLNDEIDCLLETSDPQEESHCD